MQGDKLSRAEELRYDQAAAEERKRKWDQEVRKAYTHVSIGSVHFSKVGPRGRKTFVHAHMSTHTLTDTYIIIV